MNAYELADELERVGCTTYCRCEETIPMLRQQADRIAKLEKQTKPLDPKEINNLAENCWYQDEDLEIFNYQKFAFLLQERHGIK